MSHERVQAAADLLRSSKIEDRVGALEALAQIGPPALAVLAEIVGAPDEQIVTRYWAALAIGRVGDRPDGVGAQALIALLEERAAALRRGALEALGQLGHEAHVPTLARFLTDHTEIEAAWFSDDCTVAHAAEAALRKVGGPAAERALRDAPSSG